MSRELAKCLRGVGFGLERSRGPVAVVSRHLETLLELGTAGGHLGVHTQEGVAVERYCI